MRDGKQMYDREEGTWVFWKDNMINGKGLAVVVDKEKRKIVSVIPMTRKEVDKYLSKGRWVKKSHQ
ncbi:hypothetical protein M1N80_03640 [Peptococcaceae bacterium]|nr:hypothetical protein [Peptococcaceae bacterium]